MRMCRLTAFFTLALLLAALPGDAQRRKKKDDTSLQLDEHIGKKKVMQSLDVLPEPPAAVLADASRLVFHVTPITTTGLLSKQVRDSLKNILDANRRSRIVKLRAFVAGSGDTRRVQTVLSEEFSDKRLSLPALTVVQVGALPAQSAQVVIESVAETKKPVNPHGLAFISGQLAESAEPTLTVAPLAQASLNKVAAAVRGLGLESGDVLRVTCYCSSVEDGDQIRGAMNAAFPAAAANYVQLRRSYTHGSVECEAVTRLKQTPAEPLRFVNPDGLDKRPACSQVALVGAGRLLLTGIQMAFRHQDADIRLAFDRLGKVLDEQGASYADIAHASFYPISMTLADRIRTVGSDYFRKTAPPATTMVEFEGLPSLDASFAVDAVAIVSKGRTGAKARREG
ncbi:MAG: hypothetical protein KIT09_08360 [Bryobacteraceae bacterium]|nr:hypothetical protein [Bryobacteraceae bacterium]